MSPATSSTPRLLDEIRRSIRYRHYSYRTEQAYVQWTRRFVRFHGMRQPREMGGKEVVAFLDHLANDRDVAVSTHNQALSALLFRYRDVLGVELPWLGDIARPRRPRRLPVVLTREEVQRVLAVMEGSHALMARLLYGTGMRLMECVRLRVKDLELARAEIVVRQGKGGKDRMTMVPRALMADLRAQLARARVLFAADRWECAPCTTLASPSLPPRTRCATRSPRTCWDTGYDIRTVQELLGHSDVSTTMIYTHVLNRGGRGVVSPLDGPPAGWQGSAQRHPTP